MVQEKKDIVELAGKKAGRQGKEGYKEVEA